ncbi:N,N-dimethylformamidase beta subunit family domain-containing protein [Umezawaea endophytica]|uniref:Tachylectin-related carbohydrate-binding protein n=1 Tax=Umezawaea endophytica TaxID=1654476 RepID=A0A9X2VSR0_9PSEU|nr:N,N-dimethylformamidase beta subunit family domain-containing protein [Umezawaea endophytica]MCS7482200.1 tachylectin-related carbohydrate-binding protein [Umezawaea endophytica]
MAYDQNQRFVRLVPGGTGIVYAIQADGVLLWYRHSGWQTGAASWSNGGGLAIGSGWQQFKTVLAAADGQLFAIGEDGSMRWYKYQLTDPNTGAGTWHAASGSVIRTGLQAYPRIFGGWNGVFYAIDTSGNLHWFRYLAGNGTNGAGAWHANSAAVISGGWKQYYAVFADPNGVIFGIAQGGNLLYWWRYLAGDGTNGVGAWTNGGQPWVIGSGFSDDANKSWFSNTAGTVYLVWLDTATTPGYDDKLNWFRLVNSETINGDWTGAWVNVGAPLQIGAGFSVESTAALQGYANDLSPRPGYTQGFPVSSTFTTVEATIERLAVSGQSPGTVVWGPVSQPGRLQPLPGGYRATGCGWTPDFSLTIPATWRSGVYVCRLRGVLNGVQHLRFDIPFAVKPTAPSSPIAVMLPTNTYNAYNTWAGHNAYSSAGQSGVQRTIASLRPSDSVWTDDRANLSHTFYSDQLLLRWLVTKGYSFDCYQDGDLDADGTWLGQYKALVLGSHAEYWSQTMKDRVNTYLGAGGHVIATGGNTMFEKVSWSANGDSVVFRTTSGLREPMWFANLGQPTSAVLGSDWDGSEFMTFAPYRVANTAHPFLAGSGLVNNDTFGAQSYNLAASGWEVDRRPVPSPPGAQLIAVGQNSGGDNGAEMIQFTRPGGGWVFSTGSIAFNGSLALDATSSLVLKNALDAAIV